VYEENFEKSSSSLSLGRILLFPSLDFFFLQKKKKKKKEKEKSPIHLSNTRHNIHHEEKHLFIIPIHLEE
jgi:hypothetical protein